MQRGSRNDAKRCKLEIITEIERLGGVPPHLLVACPVIMAELGPAIPVRVARSSSLSGTPLASGHDRPAWRPGSFDIGFVAMSACGRLCCKSHRGEAVE
jgi:hypothetical protein